MVTKPIEMVLSQCVRLGSYNVRVGCVTYGDKRFFGIVYRHMSPNVNVLWAVPTSREFIASIRSLVSIPRDVQFPETPHVLHCMLLAVISEPLEPLPSPSAQ